MRSDGRRFQILVRETKTVFTDEIWKLLLFNIKLNYHYWYVKTGDPLYIEYVTCNSCRHTLPICKHLFQVPEGFGGLWKQNIKSIHTYTFLPLQVHLFHNLIFCINPKVYGQISVLIVSRSRYFLSPNLLFSL